MGGADNAMCFIRMLKNKSKWLAGLCRREIKVNITLFQQIAYTTCLDATVYVGGLDEKVSESILWELFLQAGPIGEISTEIINNNTYYL